ncbi:PREDICTED: DEAD-box ATP-dependent RNA helicase 40-like isoform X2 [Lupinus angustifolius]|uniref:DEAD-box ATP-dependent RNA helicase 40-like isoform X2 n=1 Tax=Lupinus angustifolius TaxID=3871 RepID=UPI00092FC11A|nr:PREDICTED: DEAD-box ATP-dependent RNA helicase 40-like isoform X2 [Lupinus angustifolius]
MASAEAASDGAGPRYAPDDPTLLQPWKGLIDGSTGVMYYWNPETNDTQYERPAPLAPPVPAGPAPGASTPSLAPIPGAHMVQSGGVVAQYGQVHSSQQQQGNHFGQQYGQPMLQQHPSQAGQSAQHQNSQLSHSAAQPGYQARPHMMHAQGQHAMQSQGQQIMHPQGQQMHYQMSSPHSQHHGQGPPQDHSLRNMQPQAHQFTPQNMQYMSYQQNMIQSGQPNSQSVQPNMNTSGQPNSQHIQNHSMHGQPPFESQQDYKTAYPKTEETEFKNGSQTGNSPSQYQQRSGLPVQNNQSVHADISSDQLPNVGFNAGQPQQFRGLSGNVHQSPSAMQSPLGGSDLFYPHGPRPNFRNQMSPGMMHGHPSNVHPAGQKMGHEENLRGRSGNEYHYNSSKEMPTTGHHQPDMAQIPISGNRKDVMPGGSGISRNSMQNTFTPPMGPPSFSSNAPIRPPYIGSSDVSGLSQAELYCQQHEITATGDNIPPPFMSFDAAGFPPELLREIYSAGFSNPTPIQAQTWPVALQGRDIVAIAKTGSGKTLGYVIPAFLLLKQRHNNALNGPTVLVLAPTRELATQIQDEILKFCRSSRVSCTCLYGGAPKALQLKELDRGADIVVATPGRLNDILEMKKIDFGQVSLFVLDEADRMLDMGFEPQIRKIVNEIPPRRQTLMYTATWPKEVRKIANDLLVSPVQINIGSVNELAANKSITQYVEVVSQMEKQRRLEEILSQQEQGSKIIIFCSTKRLCDQLARGIGRSFGAAAIHGDKSQGERDYVLNQFRSGKSPILVATDVAARGLDIKDIRVVINYDFPTGVEDYVHRIGRTGRAGATGVAYTFFSEQDWKHAGDLIKVLEGANQPVLPQLRDIALRGPPNYAKDRGGMNRFDSGGRVGGRWEAGGRGGMRDGGFGGRGGMRDAGFGDRGGRRDGGFGGRGGMRDDGFGGRGGMGDGGGFGGPPGGMKDGGFGGPPGGMREGGRGGMRDGAGGRGGRGDFFSGRGNRGRGFDGPRGGHVGWGRGEQGPNDRYSMDGRGRGRGRGRFDNRRDTGFRNRGGSTSRSPERVRTWDASSRSRSRSKSRGRSRSRSWSHDRSRSYSHSISPRKSRSRSHGRRSYSRSHSRGRRSYSRSHSRSRRSYSRSRSPAANVRRNRPSKFSDMAPEVGAADPRMVGAEHVEQVPVVGSTGPDNPEAVVDLSH